MTTPFPTTLSTDVLVVGAGPGGLATAVSALRHGAQVLVVERRAGTSTVPRATGISTRTMEILRQWGLTAAVRAGAVDCEPSVARLPTLAAEPAEVSPSSFPSVREALAVSPSHPLLCPQDHIEPLLVEQVRRLGGSVRFGSAVTGLSTDPTVGVRAELADGTRVRARFVVGADGVRSAVRAALGIRCEPLGGLGEYLYVLFRADLAGLIGRRPHVLHVVAAADRDAVLAPVGGDRWVLGYPWFPERGESPADFPPTRCVALLRALTGLPGLAPRVLTVGRFTMAAALAERYRRGPGFLVGDAAHQMTPVGGRGLNTAVHDGHALGWRLAWVLRGLAGDALLDGYGAEREPVGRVNALRSLRPGPDAHDGLAGDLGRPAGARPGERAPHAWVRRHGRRCSTLDLFEDRLSVLTGSAGEPWEHAAAGLADLPLEVYVAGRGLADDRGALRRGYRLGERSVVLVRPDGVVAWRHDGACADPAGALAAAVGAALGHPADSALAG